MFGASSEPASVIWNLALIEKIIYLQNARLSQFNRCPNNCPLLTPQYSTVVCIPVMLDLHVRRYFNSSAVKHTAKHALYERNERGNRCKNPTPLHAENSSYTRKSKVPDVILAAGNLRSFALITQSKPHDHYSSMRMTHCVVA